jgi:drug/metabolite transporter (DMT)-like permease
MQTSSWYGAATLAGVFIAVHYMLLRAASGRLNDTLGALVLEGTATVGILLNYMFGPRGPAITPTRLGLLFSVLSGLSISGASILLFAALRRGGPVASTGTIVLGGGVALSALFAPLLFGETFTLRRAIGVGLGLAAIAVLSQEGSSAAP